MPFKLDSNFRSAVIVAFLVGIYAHGQVTAGEMFFNNPPNTWYFLPIAVGIAAYMFLTKRTPFMTEEDIVMEDVRVLFEYLINHPMAQLSFPGEFRSGHYTIEDYLCLPDGTFAITIKQTGSNLYCTFFLDGRKGVSPRKISFIKGKRIDDYGASNLMQLSRQLRAKGKTTMIEMLEDFDEDKRQEILGKVIERGGVA